MEKKYAKFDKKIKNIETQLKPILLLPSNLQSLPSDDNQLVVGMFNKELHFMNNLISQEMASSATTPNTTEPRNRHLSRLGHRVSTLLKASRAWAGGRGASPLANSADSSQSSAVIDSYVTDNDESYDSDSEVVEGDDFSRGVFEVYENPTYEGDFGDIENEYGNVDGVNKQVVVPIARIEEEVADNNYDNDQEMAQLRVKMEEVDDDRDADHEKKDDNNDQNEGVLFEDATEEEDSTQNVDGDSLREQGVVQKGFKEETVKVDCQKDSREAAKDSGKCCCYKSIFCSLLIGMGMFLMLLLQYYFPDFPDHHSAPFLPPT